MSERLTISEDDPVTLKEACKIVFRDRISPSTLRAEAAKGRLALRRIGRQDFVTLRQGNGARIRVGCSSPRARRQGAGGRLKMVEWEHKSNIDPDQARAYKKAARETGLNVEVGPPSRQGLSYMRGVYAERGMTPKQWSRFSEAYARYQSQYDNDPYRSGYSSLPTWLKVAWIVCGVCWVLVVMAWIR